MPSVITGAHIKTNWESTEKNPDEDFLKKQWQASIESLERDLALLPEHRERRKKERELLIKSRGISRQDANAMVKENAVRSREALNRVKMDLVQPIFDIEAMHKQDLELATDIGNKIEAAKAPASWGGILCKPAYGGWYASWNGEAEEKPNVTFNLTQRRFDPRVQAWGEGWFDQDFSRVSAYLAFRFTPPSYGHLHIHTSPWLHGYYSLYSDDEWFNCEYAKAEIFTWVDAYQHFWRPRQDRLRFRMAGDELHPERSNRIDRQYSHNYFANVGAGDPVTVRVGVRLFSLGRASGGRARLDFQYKNANYVYVPCVSWFLHH